MALFATKKVTVSTSKKGIKLSIKKPKPTKTKKGK